MNWNALSKIVGWEERKMEYPDKDYLDKLINQVREGNLNCGNAAQLLRYYRFLPPPYLPEQWITIVRIVEILRLIREQLD